MTKIAVRRGGNRWHLGEIVAWSEVDETDEHLGLFRWTLTSDGYAARAVVIDGRKRTLLMHREILGLAFGDPAQGDHRNGDRLDNRRDNLRVADALVNGQNKRSFQGSSSSYRGVAWNKQHGRWAAYVTPEGKRVHLGYFDDEAEAAAVAQTARASHMRGAVS